VAEGIWSVLVSLLVSRLPRECIFVGQTLFKVMCIDGV